MNVSAINLKNIFKCLFDSIFMQAEISRLLNLYFLLRNTVVTFEELEKVIFFKYFTYLSIIKT